MLKTARLKPEVNNEHTLRPHHLLPFLYEIRKMASRKRTQEEKNLRTLRELASLPANKQCFDCHQRGPTYINMTVGSFVCTSCSGILRGLNPPHRVKSITMTVFTPEEIEFIKSKGNEYCRLVWMGTHDSRSALEPEARDEQKIKDFMCQKYEKKRWYVDPDVAVAARRLQQSSAPATPEIPPDTKPLSSLLGRSPTPLVIQNNPTPSQPLNWSSQVASTQPPQSSKSVDLLSEFAGDPFGLAPTSKIAEARSPVQASATSANGNFANFESAFSSNNSNVETAPSVTSPPSADRYAALADLDSLFHQSEPSGGASPTPVAASAPQQPTPRDVWTNSVVSSSASFGVQQPNNVFATGASSNPFSSTATPTWTTVGQPQQAPHLFAANPFQAQTPPYFPLDNFPTTTGYVSASSFVTAPPNGAVLPTYGIQNGNVGYSWGPGWVQQQGAPPFQTTKMPANPFMGNAVLAAPRGNSSNPFL